jgi:hypothetical protein
MTAPCANPRPFTPPLKVWITAARLALDGYRGRVTARLAPTILAIGLLAAALTACDATPDPVETPPVFASEEEAFAAAEETYRAYVDALNNVDLSDPATFEDVYVWTTGDANANERENLTRMHADGWAVSGATRVAWFEGREVAGEEIVAFACADVSSIDVRNERGESMVAADRAERYTLELILVESASTATGLVIEASNAIEDDQCR